MDTDYPRRARKLHESLRYERMSQRGLGRSTVRGALLPLLPRTSMLLQAASSPFACSSPILALAVISGHNVIRRCAKRIVDDAPRLA
jgi:hypothetical protein